MAFHEVNQKKLAFLLALGTHEGELKKFFVESRTQLIMRGARVQNLPQGRDERIRAICERLPQKTNDTLRDWGHKNISVSDPLPLSDVLTYLELQFDADEVIPEADARLVARSTLMYLFEEAPDPDLLAFLQRAPGARPTLDDAGPSGAYPPDSRTGQGADAISDDMLIEGMPALQGYQLSELLASIIAGDDGAIDDALAPFPQNTHTLVEALLRARDGDIDAAHEQLALLSPESTESELVRRAISRARHQRGARSSPTGIRVIIPPPLTKLPDDPSYDIVGICLNELDTGAVFVQPIALVVDGRLYVMGREDCVRLFPESGVVMTYRPAMRRPPARRDLVRWRVAEREGVEGRTHFHMVAELSPLIEVLQLPVPSTDPDEVRERIKAMALSGRPLAGQQTVLLLSDGVAVTSPKSVDLARDEAFDQPWQAWTSLETWLIEGRQYCLDLARSAASALDLSPLETAFKKLIKNLESEQKSTLSKAQKRELADLLRNHSAGEAALRGKRIAACLDQITLDGEQLDSVLQLLNSREEVQRRVEQLVANNFEERQADKSGLQAEIEALKRKKAKLVKEGRDLERNNNKTASTTAARVKEAFTSAINDGVATLANAEIFRALVGSSVEVSAQTSASTVAASVESWTIKNALALQEVKERLIALGLNGRQAVVLFQLSALTKKSGVGFVLKGLGARQYAQVLVRVDCDASGVIGIPMGLTSSESLRLAIDRMPDVQRLAILDADLSPLEAYGTRLVDSLFDSALNDQGDQVSLLFSCLGSDMSLPLPDLMRRVAVVVDLDTPWTEGQRAMEEIEVDSIPLLEPLRSRILDGLSALEGSSREQVERALIMALVPEG